MFLKISKTNLSFVCLLNSNNNNYYNTKKKRVQSRAFKSKNNFTGEQKIKNK